MKKTFSLIVFALANTFLFAQGYYMEYKLSSGDQGSGFSGSMKTYAQDGNSRMEMDMNMPNMGAVKMTSLVLKSSPEKVYLVDEKSKSYSELSGNGQEDWKDHPESEYEITLVGKEKVNGYNTTHVKVKRKGEKTDMEMWTTTEIDGYAEYSKIKTRYTGKDNLLKALEEKGAKGFPVRIKTNEDNHPMQIDLVKAEKRTNPASLFSLAGYTKSAGYLPNSTNNNVQEMMKKIQNMTPEEREKWIKQMQDQYQQN